jgi:L-lysine 2,3-aminomutase
MKKYCTDKNELKNDIKEALKFLTDNSNKLSLNQNILIKGINRYFQHNKKLSDKQRIVLFEIKKQVNCSTVAEIDRGETAKAMNDK